MSTFLQRDIKSFTSHAPLTGSIITELYILRKYSYYLYDVSDQQLLIFTQKYLLFIIRPLITQYRLNLFGT